MIRCGNCGGEVEDGHNFCPYCAQPLLGGGASESWREDETGGAGLQRSARGRERFLTEEDLEPPAAVPLSSFEDRGDEAQKSQRKLYMVVGAASVVVLVGLILLFSTDAGRALLPSSGGAGAERLEGAYRPGSPEFDQALAKIFLDFNADEDAFTSPRPVGDIVITMKPTIRNFTGRTINGLELRGAGYDLGGQVVKERTFVVIPNRQPEIEPNRTMSPSLLLEGIGQNNMPASLRVEIVAVRFK